MPLLTLLLPIFQKVLSLIPDPAQRAEQLQALITAVSQIDTAQQQVNAAEAATGNIFIGGWRPAIGWVCAFALLYQYVLMPFITWGFIAWHVTLPLLPTLDNNLWEITTGMLGLGGLHVIEKINS